MSAPSREHRNPTLWAISDLHIGHTGNKPVTESLHPASPDDWLIVAGDVAERTDDIRWSLDLLRKRFAKVIWVPGNHELWTTNNDPMQIFGRARYDYLVNMCDEMGIVTPEHPFPVWTNEGGPATIVPMFLLYDYTFLPEGAATKAEGLAVARERNVVATDEFLLSAEPYATRDAWCRDRIALHPRPARRARWFTPAVLVNHFPLVRQPCDVCSTRSSRCGAAPPPRRSGTPATTRCARCTGTCTFRGPRGTTACGSRRCRWATRESGGAASRIDGCARSCPTRSIRPDTSTSSVDASITSEMRSNAEKTQERIKQRPSRVR